VKLKHLAVMIQLVTLGVRCAVRLTAWCLFELQDAVCLWVRQRMEEGST
jgi:hypothetical protein